jgi:hypothetical protein
MPDLMAVFTLSTGYYGMAIVEAIEMITITFL